MTTEHLERALQAIHHSRGHVTVRLGQGAVRVPVPERLLARFFAHFADGSRTEPKRARFATLMELMEAAYHHGWQEGRSSIRIRSTRDAQSARARSPSETP